MTSEQIGNAIGLSRQGVDKICNRAMRKVAHGLFDRHQPVLREFFPHRLKRGVWDKPTILNATLP